MTVDVESVTEYTVQHIDRWWHSARQCIVVLTFPSPAAAERFRNDPDAAIHIEARYREARR
jgi:uncharacterized protein (DUF1330 family)